MIGRVLAGKYAIVKKLSEGIAGELFLADDIAHNDTVVIRALVIDAAAIPIDEVVRLKKNIRAASRLDHPQIVGIREAIEARPYLFLVMNYAPGDTLRCAIMRQNRSPLMNGMYFPLPVILSIARQLAQGLAAIHDAGLVHGNLAPEAVVLSDAAETDAEHPFRIMISDIGIFPFGDTAGFDAADRPEGAVQSLCYRSPERSRCLPDGTDGRSDLYSLGTIIYELISGRPPFCGDDPHVIIQQHASAKPQSPGANAADMPPALAAMTLKLLEKNPADRYQSAVGFLNDCVKLRNGQTDFRPGMEDLLINPGFFTDFIGREKEFGQVQDHLGRAVKGSGSILLISGEAGIGKTRLIEELRQHIVVNAVPAVCLIGKCQAGETKTPYLPFGEVLNGYHERYESAGDDEKRKISRRLKNAIGELGNLIVKLNPLMEDLLGECPPVMPLDPKRDMDRFLFTAVLFFNTLSKMESCLVLVIEDMQWIDHGSGSLLLEMMRRIKNFPLLVIGTYRDEEIGPGHVLRTLFAAAMKNQYPLARLSLQAFTGELMRHLLAALLNRNAGDKSIFWLSDYVHKKSNGSPLFAIEIVKYLFENGLIMHDAHNQLVVDRNGIHAMDVPELFVDILLKRLSTLDDDEREVLSFAAVIGRRCDRSFLIDASRALVGIAKSEDDHAERMDHIITRAINLHLLSEDPDDRRRIVFSHDLVRDALYRGIDGDRARRYHLSIVTALEERYRREIESDLYHCAGLYDLAHHAVQAGDSSRMFAYSYPAGLRAVEDHAYDDAIQYLSVALMLAEAAGHTSRDWLDINRIIGDIYIITGKNVEAISLLRGIERALASPEDRAYTHKQISKAYFNLGDLPKCELFGRSALSILGERVPDSRWRLYIGIIRELAAHGMHVLVSAMYRSRKITPQHAKYRLIIEIYYALSWSFAFKDSLNFVRSTLRILNIAETRFGRSRELAKGMTIFGALCFSIYQFDRSRRYLVQALSLRHALDDEWGACQTIQLLGYCHYYQADFERAMEYFDQSIAAFERIGDMTELGYSLLGKMLTYHFIADYENEMRVLERYEDLSEKLQDTMGIYMTFVFKGLLYLEIESYTKAEEYLARVYELSRDERYAYVNCMAAIMYGRLYYEQGDFDSALLYLERARVIDEQNNFIRDNVNHLYYHRVMLFVRDYQKNQSRLSPAERKRYLAKIKRASMQALRMTRRSPLQYPICQTVVALYHALVNNHKKAERLFVAGISRLKRHSVKRELAQGLYNYGIFLEQAGRSHDAWNRVHEAYELFNELGCVESLNRAEAFLGIDEAKRTLSMNDYVQWTRDKERLASLVSVITIIKSALPRDEMLGAVLAILLRLSGAEQGTFFLRDQQGDCIPAAVYPADGVKPDVEVIGMVHRTMSSGHMLRSVSAAGNRQDAGRPGQHAKKSIVSVPVTYQKNTIGVCVLENSITEILATDEELEAVALIIDQVSIAIGASLITKNMEKSILFEPDTGFYKQYAITDKEKDIILLFVKGFTRNGISKELGITYGTVKWHLKNIYAKLGVNDKTELIDLIRRYTAIIED